MPMNGTFDARQIQPRQAGDAHPPGKFQATISNTSIVATKDNSGGMFVVEFTTPAGTIVNRYNLWNSSPKAVEIAQHELSALCHATGVFALDFQNDGAALRGARCMIDVGNQTDKEGKPTNYMEIKKVLDPNGNEPGKNAPQGQPTNQPTQPQNQPPMQQNQPGGAWGNSPQNNVPPANQGGWGGNPAPNPAPAGNPASPPWGR